MLDRLKNRFRAPATWPADRPVRFITSFNPMLFEASGRTCLQTFRTHNPDFELVAYLEGDGPDADRMVADVEALGVRAVALEQLPLLEEFRTLAADVIPREFGGDAPPEMFPGEGPQTGDVWFRKNMFRWFRKIVALDHAVADHDDVLLWMDCDCRSVAPLPRTVVERAFDGAGLIYMQAKRSHSETGLVGYDLGVGGTRELVVAMREHYTSRAFESLPRWDDCMTLDLCRERPDAPPSRDIARKVSANAEVLPSTPFGPYLEHDKGLHSRGLGLVR